MSPLLFHYINTLYYGKYLKGEYLNMKNSVVIWSTFSALTIAVIYDQINQTTGIKVIPLLYFFTIIMVIELFIWLRGNAKYEKKEKI